MRIAVCDDELVCTQLICEHLNTILRLQAVEAAFNLLAEEMEA